MADPSPSAHHLASNSNAEQHNGSSTERKPSTRKVDATAIDMDLEDIKRNYYEDSKVIKHGYLNNDQYETDYFNSVKLAKDPSYRSHASNHNNSMAEVPTDLGQQYAVNVDYGYNKNPYAGDSDYEDAVTTGRAHNSSENLRDHSTKSGVTHRPSIRSEHLKHSGSRKATAIKDDDSKNSDNDEDDEDDDSYSVISHNKSKKKDLLSSISFWYRLSPFMRYLIVGALGAVLFIIPAILIAVYADVSYQDRSSTILYTKYVAVDWLTWIGFMWMISMVNHFSIDRIPRIVVKINHMIWGVCTEKTKWRIEYFIAIKFYIKILLFCSWAWGSFAFTQLVYPSSPYLTQDDIDNKRSFHTPDYYITVYRIFMALFFGSILLLVEKMILQIIAIRFHRTAYRDRIRQNKNEVKVLDKLSDAARRMRRGSQTQYNNMGGGTASGMSTPGWFGTGVAGFTAPISHIRKFSQPQTHEAAPIPLAEMPTASDATINGSTRKTKPNMQPPQLISALNRKLQYIAMADQPHLQTNRIDMNSNHHARKQARWLYETLSDGTFRELTVEDFYKCFATNREAEEAFAIFDRDNNGDVSRREMRDVMLRVYKERKDLASALRDMSQCVGKLDNILLVLALIIYVFMVLNIVSGKNVATTVLPFGSLLVALSFIFGQSAKNTFDSIIFVFVTHPYDTGDLVYVDTNQMVVTNVGLLTTTFCRTDGQLLYAPNIILSSKFIHNIRRSQNMSETIEVQVDFYTPHEKITELARRLEEFLETHMAREFVPKITININSIDNTNRLALTMFIEHRSNWQDGGRRWARRTKFMMALKEIITDLDLRYFLPPQRVEYIPPHTPPTDQPWAPFPRNQAGVSPSGGGQSQPRQRTTGNTTGYNGEMANQALVMDQIM
ncbi:Mechanosensitive ion channel-domain-containing protein [Syncephalis fuscata]|nr:Mechanosensitive ion channel-domain-containing protein [Syncephalis fuscata]